MVNFFEVFLLAEFVIGRPCLFSNNSSLIEFLLKHLKFVGELSIFPIDLWNVGNLAEVKLALSFFLKPFLLEVFESLLHAKLDEEVTQEFICKFLFPWVLV